ncbi:MAG: pyrroline-5-carboxylate reductase, partial [Spirochaetales bacterium]
MFSAQRLGFLGSGNMAEALMRGIIARNLWPKQHLVASDVSSVRLSTIHEALGIDTTADNRQVAARSDMIIVATKPAQVVAVLSEIADTLSPDKLIVSIAAGVTLATIQSALKKDIPVIRVMPNAPALVLAGMSCLSAGRSAGEDHLAQAMKVFSGVGEALIVEEAQLDAVTALSGSGPAYLFLVIEALSDAGVRVGLPRKIAEKLSVQTVLGAARMVLETGKHPGELKDMVASPAGTTIEGLAVLEETGVRGAFIEAV